MDVDSLTAFALSWQSVDGEVTVLMNDSKSRRRWCFPGFDRQLGEFPLIMGILNATPDSFSDGGRYLAIDQAVEHGRKLAEDGADILDIGGESTRPGSEPVPLDEELRRVIPVIERLAPLLNIPISVDTSKAEVARQALLAGARIVNDISGLQFDSEMIRVCVENPCGVICMHIQGTPQTMQIDPRYQNVVEEIFTYFSRRLQELSDAGLPPERVVIDPGVGFGKTAQHNIEIMTSLSRFQQSGRPVLIGHSRKRFLQKVLNRPLNEALYGTIGVSLGLAAQNVDLLRVHDVAANRDALLGWQALRQG